MRVQMNRTKTQKGKTSMHAQAHVHEWMRMKIRKWILFKSEKFKQLFTFPFSFQLVHIYTVPLAKSALCDGNEHIRRLLEVLAQAAKQTCTYIHIYIGYSISCPPGKPSNIRPNILYCQGTVKDFFVSVFRAQLLMQCDKQYDMLWIMADFGH